jgi:hypothetical protein
MPRKRTTVERACLRCGAPFATRTGAAHCSQACGALARRTRIDRRCDRCGELFPVTPSAVRAGKRYCSERCRRGTGEQRFWSYVERSPDCWRWTGYYTVDGYGRMRWGGRMVLAHRISWEIHRGPLPADWLVLHKCPGGGNRWCVRPDHLAARPPEVAYLENADDMIQAGRQWSTTGAWHPREMWEEIRRLMPAAPATRRPSTGRARRTAPV